MIVGKGYGIAAHSDCPSGGAARGDRYGRPRDGVVQPRGGSEPQAASGGVRPGALHGAAARAPRPPGGAEDVLCAESQVSPWEGVRGG